MRLMIHQCTLCNAHDREIAWQNGVHKIDGMCVGDRKPVPKIIHFIKYRDNRDAFGGN